ncbi:c-type cytochrome [Chthonobacter albigriseus]|uniref:c-type cytochrome n=1 Tax=Chthonobacter albigriseus TaxID=1683161 RepID=UPI0015EEA11F|nr:cytochrome c [Chthonobacter albigriseus]
MRVPLLLMSAFVFLLAPAAHAGVAEGKAIAEQWCQECHLVKGDQAEGTESAPPFPEIAAKRSDQEIVGFLFDPHPPMAQLNLSRQETKDLVAYIRSQAK